MALFFFSFYGPGGVFTPHKPIYLASFATSLLAFNSFKRREETREEYSQRQLGSRLGCVQRRLGGDKQGTPPFVTLRRVVLKSAVFSTSTQAAWNGLRRIRGRFIALLRRPAALQQGEFSMCLIPPQARLFLTCIDRELA